MPFKLAVVDHDAAWGENFGSHLLVSTATDGTAKVTLLRNRLVADHPDLKVMPKAERFRLFSYRVGTDVPVPDVVISGLDKARPRQEVQRLWAPLHIDMATKDGLQVQVLVRTNPGRGMSMIQRFPTGMSQRRRLNSRSAPDSRSMRSRMISVP